jgi:hypothetical protein
MNLGLDYVNLIVKLNELHFPQATSSIDRCAECRKPFPCPTIRNISLREL